MQGIVYVIIAACTGYYYCMRAHRWRYTLLRKEGYHVYLYATGWGLIFALSCICLTNLALNNIYDISLRINHPEYVRLSRFFTGDAESEQLYRIWLFMFVSFLLADIASRITNFFCNRVESITRAWNDDLDLLAAYSINHKDQISENHDPLALMITTSSRKVYVGYVAATFEPSDQSSYLTIIPMISGYRDKDTLELRLTHKYQQIIEAVERRDARLVELYRQVISRSEISTVHVFHESIYNQVVDERLRADEEKTSSGEQSGRNDLGSQPNH